MFSMYSFIYVKSIYTFKGKMKFLISYSTKRKGTLQSNKSFIFQTMSLGDSTYYENSETEEKKEKIFYSKKYILET
jgi:hypothetical protein